MKILTVTISDENHCKLEDVKKIKKFGNNAEAVAWLIQTGFQQLIKEKVKESKS